MGKILENGKLTGLMSEFSNQGQNVKCLQTELSGRSQSRGDQNLRKMLRHSYLQSRGRWRE